MTKIYDEVEEAEMDEMWCPACGWYCLGKGGQFCIDKPAILAAEWEKEKGK